MALFLDTEPLLEVNNPRSSRSRGGCAAATPIRESWQSGSTVGSTTRCGSRSRSACRARSRRSRRGRGDCNEHTQLSVALSRAAGIPARVAAGLAYVDGKFYYHAWPEIWLERWVAIDPTFGQFPADAAHLRFTVGGLGRQAELLRLMGPLKIRYCRRIERSRVRGGRRVRETDITGDGCSPGELGPRAVAAFVL